ncbi:hypothetical protein [Paenibacillus apiarius]|uniref:hypothetical protein n=1 Tax=Paenibacillus apiarius TaxID=46240 RepID=UPI001980D7FA|nr:hypothetical protein [Paenibacillus apiarius]MBN3526516.1 hypothetical protein [Paenibacillus apiarius]
MDSDAFFGTDLHGNQLVMGFLNATLGSDGSEFSAIGIWGHYIYVNQKEGVVIVKTSTDPDFLANEHETMIAFRAIADAVK